MTIFLFLLLVREEKVEEGDGCMGGGWVMEASEKRKGDRQEELDEEKGAVNLHFLFRTGLSAEDSIQYIEPIKFIILYQQNTVFMI